MLPRVLGLAAIVSMACALCGAVRADPLAEAFAAHARYLSRQAVAYEHGEGVAKEPARAAAMYCEAARLGDAEGMYALGWMYANGRGLPRNDAYAATLFAMAAYLGHEHAKRMMRYTGDDVGAVPECLQPPRHLLSAELWDATWILATLDARRRPIAEMVAALAPEYGVSPRLALAVALAESALDPLARSPKDAMGVMQLIPATAERFAVQKPWEPEQNIRGGLRYLRWLLAYFRGDVRLAVAAYNAGEGAVDRHGGVPPYPETRQYVDRVLGLAQQHRHPYDHSLVAPSPAVTVAPQAPRQALAP